MVGRIVSALDRKLLRDLWQMKGQALAICLVMASGAAMFVMSQSTLQSLAYTQSTYYERYRFADVFAHVKRAPNALAARFAEIPGVVRVQTRVVMDVTLNVPGLSEPATGRLISMPERGPPILNDLYLRRGRLLEPGRPGEALVSEAFAVSQRDLPDASARSKTLVGASIAGTLEYSAPEQLGKLPGVAISKRSDVYAFGRMSCYALFGTPYPLATHWNSIPPGLAKLLEECLKDSPPDRPADFAVVAERLAKVRHRRRRVESTSSGLVTDAIRQLPLNQIAKEFSEVEVQPKGKFIHVRVIMNPTMEGAKSEGWQTGVALDGSASMRKWYGDGIQGQVPPDVLGDYQRRGWIVEKVEDGRRVKSLKSLAREDAVKRGFLQLTANIVQPLARDFVALLAERLDEDGGTTVIYWACGDGSNLETCGDFNAQQCRTLELSGPKHFGSGTRLLPAVRYFVDRFHDANKGIYVFLADGKFDDLEEVKSYTRQLAHSIAAGQRNFVKCVLVGIGDSIDAKQMEELDDLDTGTDVDIWDHKLALEMRTLNDIFAELVDENQIVAPWAQIHDANGNVVKKFSRGLPARVDFKVPAGTPWFELELRNLRIRQSIS